MLAGYAVCIIVQCQAAPDDEFTNDMLEKWSVLGAILRECGQGQWANPPLEVLFADGLSAEEADAHRGEDGGGVAPNVSIHSALSYEYHDVYSDA